MFTVLGVADRGMIVGRGQGIGKDVGNFHEG